MKAPRARLDADKTAKPIARIVQHIRVSPGTTANDLCQGPGINVPDTYVSGETSISLNDTPHKG